MASRVTCRDLWDLAICEAHSVEESDGKASTKNIAKALNRPVAQIGAKLKGMQARGLCISHWPEWDETVDWTLTAAGVEHAEWVKDNSPADQQEGEDRG